MTIPPNESVTINVTPSQVRIEDKESEGVRLRSLVFLTPFAAVRIGSFTDEQWEDFIQRLANPEAAALAEQARSRIIHPTAQH